MLLPLHTSVLSFSTKPQLPLFFPSPNLSPHHPKFTLHNSSSSSTPTPPPPKPQTIPKSAIKRIAEKLQTLGYIEQTKLTQPPQTTTPTSPGHIFLPFPDQLPNHRVGHTIDSSWTTPLNPVPQPGSGVAITRFHELKKEVEKEKRVGKKEGRVPTLAELKVSEEELRRLRTIGVALKKKLNVGKPGVTEGIVNGIHERWRRSEVVKIRCEDLCKMNMQRTHDTLERKTGGLVVWRSGGTIILYRGANYKYPYFSTTFVEKDDTYLDESSSESSMNHGGDGHRHNNIADTAAAISGSPNHFNKVSHLPLIHGVGAPNRVRFQLPGEAQLSEEADCLLDGLGPRFTDWWGYDPLPVDGDLLPAIIPGYRRPFRLLPYGIKPKLTDDEMTTLRRLSRPLPCHFALGRNKRLQGLAVSMVKLWEKCEIAKIAVKHGVQNTNSDMMAEELKWLTGGVLLSRDKEFITFYRGKDFLPSAVSTAIEERRKHGARKEKQLEGEIPSMETMPHVDVRAEPVSCDAEHQEAIQKKMDVIAEQRKRTSASSRIKRISTKLSVALEKKDKAEKLLVDLEEASEPQKTEVDKEGITEEERYMLKKVGLRMKAYLPLGRRGIFDGTVENMHLHWKYRELVKIMGSERSIEDVHAAARTLEAESGGILVAVEKVNREYAIIVYRGKNYQRPADLRPRTLLNKKQAMKRSIEAQRRESLKLHVLKLTKSIDQLKLQLVKDDTETKNAQRNDNTAFETSDSCGSEKYCHNERGASSVESTADQESYSSVDAPSNSEEDTLLHKLMDTASKYVGPAESELKSTTEPKFCETYINALQSEVFEAVSDSTASTVNTLSPDAATCSDGEAHLNGSKLFESSLDVERNKCDPSVDGDIESASNLVAPFKAVPLSNRDRLLLRKQALKMRKRPVLAIGRSNVVDGVARTIKTHFKKNPLAIVNIKGRAEGTSVQEVIFKLEQATGAVLVSQETNKVILYRGWGMEEGQVVKDTRNIRPTGRKPIAQEVVSPQLMEAIRLECGLQINQEE